MNEYFIIRKKEDTYIKEIIAVSYSSQEILKAIEDSKSSIQAKEIYDTFLFVEGNKKLFQSSNSLLKLLEEIDNKKIERENLINELNNIDLIEQGTKTDDEFILYVEIKKNEIEKKIKNLGSLPFEENIFGDGKIKELYQQINNLLESNKLLNDIYDNNSFEFKEKLTSESFPKLAKACIEVSRNQKVRTVEDSIADLAKMNSLLFSCISAMYGTMSDTAKSKIDEGTKELIDYSVEKFSNTQTRADRQLVKEGTGLVDKLFDREVQIADIIDEVKGE